MYTVSVNSNDHDFQNVSYHVNKLAKYNNNNYALKIQHILPNDKNESYKKRIMERT